MNVFKVSNKTRWQILFGWQILLAFFFQKQFFGMKFSIKYSDLDTFTQEIINGKKLHFFELCRLSKTLAVPVQLIFWPIVVSRLIN